MLYEGIVIVGGLFAFIAAMGIGANDVANANNILTEKKELDVDEDNEYEDMFVKTAFQNMEWGGPLRGGRLPEPTRFGDWERKGRCTDY